jgi:2,4-dienoyl-CoA reductase-like NADH-dependent reductase (Old Yellow Enzyme family)
MEENLAGEGQLPDERITELYRTWGHAGPGLITTGNVMADARALTGPGGIVLDEHTDLEPLTRWAAAAKADGAKDLDADQPPRPAGVRRHARRRPRPVGGETRHR